MRFTLILILSIICINSRSQNATDSIDFEKVDLPFLELLVKNKVDSIRQNFGLSILKKDDVLYKAAMDQAVYLKNRRKIGHFQQAGDNRKNAFSRAQYYGATDLKVVGENVAWNHLERKEHKDPSTGDPILVYPYTYNKLADELVLAWIQSETHYQNLQTEEYQYTGVAIVFDKLQMEFTCVQVFAGYEQ